MTNTRSLISSLKAKNWSLAAFFLIFLFLVSVWPFILLGAYGDGNYGDSTYGDITAPTLAEVTPVTTPTTDTTPDYTFSSDEAGTITYGGSCSSATTSATSGNNTITFNTLSEGTYDNCTITVTDSFDNESDILAITVFTISASDSTPPTLTEVTPVSTPTTDTTPDYTFNTNEAGTISYGGSCSSSTTSATSGNNTITFNTLALGTYSDCTITVTDSSSNASSALDITTFTVTATDTTAPTLAEVTPVTTPTTDTTPDYTFSSDEAGTITYGGSCSSATTSATSGNNTITFNTLSEGTYDNCTITVTDSFDNASNSLPISDFTIVADIPEEEDETEINLSRPRIKWVDIMYRFVNNSFPKLNKKEFVLSGTDPDMAGGEIAFSIEGQKYGRTTVDEQGKWKKKIRSKKNGKLELTLKYTKGYFEEKRHYDIFIDSEDPVFDPIPSLLTARSGHRIYWSAQDNDRIKYYRYEFRGEITKTTKPEFLLPGNVPPGRHPLVIRAYDRAGNRETQTTIILVR